MNLITILFLFSLSTTSWASKFEAPTAKNIAEAQGTFKFRGHWISPKIVKEFLPWESDYAVPLVTSIDIGSATNTNRFFGTFEESGMGASFKEDDGSVVRYDWKGKLSNGMHVLVVTEAGSGSMVSNSLVVFKISSRQAIDSGAKKYSQLLLEVQRVVTLGDRAQAKVSLKGNQIDVDVECEKTCDSKHFRIKL